MLTSLFWIVYHSLIIFSVVLSFMAVYNGHKRYLCLLLVLVFTEMVEAYVYVAILKGAKFSWLYHLFVPVEYVLLALYFRLAIKIPVVKKILVFSIPIFTVTSLLISWQLYHFKSFPGVNITTEGFLLFISCVILLFNLDVTNEESIRFNPDVWISIGILMFEGGTFFYNCVYTRLLVLDPKAALRLFGLINKPLNLCLYTLINIGLLCLLQKRKYITQ